MNIDESYDFGFSAIDANEIGDVSDSNKRLLKMYNMITPLINNLLKNPKKEYIHWPNREESLKEFKLKLQELLDEKDTISIDG